MKDEASRIYGNTFINKANSMFFPQKFTLGTLSNDDPDP